MKTFFQTLTKRFGRQPRTRTVRPFKHGGRLLLEQLDDRLVLSSGGLSSAISIYHPATLYTLAWTERAWYTVDQATNQVVEYQGTTRFNLGGPTDLFALSAATDPNTGHAEVFGLGGWTGQLWLCDSAGYWHSFAGNYGSLSATLDGHVYVVTLDHLNVRYLDSSGNAADLGAPNTGSGPYVYDYPAASVGWFGDNEVFAIGPGRALYVNSVNAAGQWGLVDNSQQFWFLSAAPTDTVFGVTVGGKLFEETESFHWIGWYGYWVWSRQDISAGRSYHLISADTDASAQAEVYAIDPMTHAAYRYDQGGWTWVDSDVYDISGADGGYFYDVNYASGSYNGWQFNPNGSWYSPYWTYLNSGLM
jgi:hypothetical protein